MRIHISSQKKKQLKSWIGFNPISCSSTESFTFFSLSSISSLHTQYFIKILFSLHFKYAFTMYFLKSMNIQFHESSCSSTTMSCSRYSILSFPCYLFSYTITASQLMHCYHCHNFSHYLQNMKVDLETRLNVNGKF